jgi:hypothetical protein
MEMKTDKMIILVITGMKVSDALRQALNIVISRLEFYNAHVKLSEAHGGLLITPTAKRRVPIGNTSSSIEDIKTTEVRITGGISVTSLITDLEP